MSSLRPGRVSAGLLVISTLLTFAVGAGPAAAALVWGPSSVVTDPAAASYNPVVAVDTNGDVFAAWAASHGSGPGTNWSVEVAERPHGGSWSTATALASGPNVALGGLVADSAGDATVSWTDQTHAYTSRRPAGGSWQATPDSFQLATGYGTHTIPDALSTDADGDTVMLLDKNTLSGDVAYGVYRPAGGSWQTPTALEPPPPAAAGPANTLRAAAATVNDTGAAAVVWTEQDLSHSGTHNVLYASRYVPGTGWSSAPTTLSNPSLDALDPTVASDVAGDLTAAWVTNDGHFGGAAGPDYQVVGSDYSPSTSGWTADAIESTVLPYAAGPVVGFDAYGDATAAWLAGKPGAQRIQSASRQHGAGTWGSAVNVSATMALGGPPSLAYVEQTYPMLAWIQQLPGDSPKEVIASQTLLGWEKPQELGPASSVQNQYGPGFSGQAVSSRNETVSDFWPADSSQGGVIYNATANFVTEAAGSAAAQQETASVPVACGARASCTVTGELTATEQLTGRQLVGLAARATNRTITIGETTRTIGSRRTIKLRISLNATGRALLHKRRSLRVTLNVLERHVTVRSQLVNLHRRR